MSRALLLCGAALAVHAVGVPTPVPTPPLTYTQCTKFATEQECPKDLGCSFVLESGGCMSAQCSYLPPTSCLTTPGCAYLTSEGCVLDTRTPPVPQTYLDCAAVSITPSPYDCESDPNCYNGGPEAGGCTSKCAGLGPTSCSLAKGCVLMPHLSSPCVVDLRVDPPPTKTLQCAAVPKDSCKYDPNCVYVVEAGGCTSDCESLPPMECAKDRTCVYDMAVGCVVNLVPPTLNCTALSTDVCLQHQQCSLGQAGCQSNCTGLSATNCRKTAGCDYDDVAYGCVAEETLPPQTYVNCSLYVNNKYDCGSIPQCVFSVEFGCSSVACSVPTELCAQKSGCVQVGQSCVDDLTTAAPGTTLAPSSPSPPTGVPPTSSPPTDAPSQGTVAPDSYLDCSQYTNNKAMCDAQTPCLYTVETGCSSRTCGGVPAEHCAKVPGCVQVGQSCVDDLTTAAPGGAIPTLATSSASPPTGVPPTSSPPTDAPSQGTVAPDSYLDCSQYSNNKAMCDAQTPCMYTVETGCSSRTCGGVPAEHCAKVPGCVQVDQSCVDDLTTIAPGTTMTPGTTTAPGTTPDTMAPGTTMTPGTTIAPGTTMTPGTTMSPGTTIAPGTTMTPGSTMAPGSTALPSTPSEDTGVPMTPAPFVNCTMYVSDCTAQPECYVPEGGGCASRKCSGTGTSCTQTPGCMTVGGECVDIPSNTTAAPTVPSTTAPAANCTTLKDEASCSPASCTWVPSLAQCHIACSSAQSSQECLDALHCTLNGTSCIDTPATPQPAEPCVGLQQEGCTADAQCAWEGGACKVVRRVPQCTSYGAEGECSADTRCKWDTPESTCYWQCEEAILETQCLGEASCSWSTVEHRCVRGPCSTYIEENTCSTQGGDACKWNSMRSTCDSACDPLPDKTKCAAQSGCIWDDHLMTGAKCVVVLAAPEPTLCRLHLREKPCDADTRCSWDPQVPVCTGGDRTPTPTLTLVDEDDDGFPLWIIIASGAALLCCLIALGWFACKSRTPHDDKHMRMDEELHNQEAGSYQPSHYQASSV